ncbi:MAG: hypothetical protein WCH61_03760, partial [bacterium]
AQSAHDQGGGQGGAGDGALQLAFHRRVFPDGDGGVVVSYSGPPDGPTSGNGKLISSVGAMGFF